MQYLVKNGQVYEGLKSSHAGRSPDLSDYGLDTVYKPLTILTEAVALVIESRTGDARIGQNGSPSCSDDCIQLTIIRARAIPCLVEKSSHRSILSESVSDRSDFIKCFGQTQAVLNRPPDPDSSVA